MKTLILGILTLSGTFAQASTDYRCQANCQAAGGGYQFCQSRCEYNPSPSADPFGQVTMPDRACVQSCQASGYQYQLCQQRCR